jgi:hypothetical protein
MCTDETGPKAPGDAAQATNQLVPTMGISGLLAKADEFLELAGDHIASVLPLLHDDLGKLMAGVDDLDALTRGMVSLSSEISELAGALIGLQHLLLALRLDVAASTERRNRREAAPSEPPADPASDPASEPAAEPAAVAEGI